MDNNISLTKPNGSNASGKYRGVKDGKMKLDKGIISHDSSVDEPLEPKSLLPIDIIADVRFTSMTTLINFPTTLTAANNGYYKINPVPQSSSYTIDTSLGDVVIKLNRLEFLGKANFNVIGPNNFYIYIEDNNLSDGGFVDGKNNVSFTSSNNQPKTFIIIDQPANDRVVIQNDIELKNTLTLYGYIYAPYSDIEFKNKPIIVGSLVAGNLKAKNKFEVVFIQPNSGSSIGNSNGDLVIQVTTIKNEYTEVIVTTNSNHPLDVIPISISKNWVSK